jgi:hypothetical protein
MGERTVMQEALFYSFSMEQHVPARHLLRSIDRFVDLSSIREHLRPFYSETGRPSIDPELMIRMLIVGYCFGIRSERRLCEEVHLNLAYRWFYRLGLDGAVPDHSTFSKNRRGRFPRQRSPAGGVRDDRAELHDRGAGRWRGLRGRRQHDQGRREPTARVPSPTPARPLTINRRLSSSHQIVCFNASSSSARQEILSAQISGGSVTCASQSKVAKSLGSSAQSVGPACYASSKRVRGVFPYAGMRTGNDRMPWMKLEYVRRAGPITSITG